jgi:hypothetical protein
MKMCRQKEIAKEQELTLIECNMVNRVARVRHGPRVKRVSRMMPEAQWGTYFL